MKAGIGDGDGGELGASVSTYSRQPRFDAEGRATNRSKEMQRIAWLTWPEYSVRAAKIGAAILSAAVPSLQCAIVIRGLQAQIGLLGLRSKFALLFPPMLPQAMLGFFHKSQLDEKIWSEAEPQLCPTCLTGRVGSVNSALGVVVPCVGGPLMLAFQAHLRGMRSFPFYRNWHEGVAYLWSVNKGILRTAIPASLAIAWIGAALTVQLELYARDRVLPILAVHPQTLDEQRSQLAQTSFWTGASQKWSLWWSTNFVARTYHRMRGHVGPETPAYADIVQAMDEKYQAQLDAEEK